LTPVTHPAFHVAKSFVAHVAEILSLPVAGCVTNSRATIVVAHLLEAIVSKPTRVAVVISTVAPDLSLVTRLIVRFKVTLILPVAGTPTLATLHWKLSLKWDPRSWAPGKGKRGRQEEQKREHL